MGWNLANTARERRPALWGPKGPLPPSNIQIFRFYRKIRTHSGSFVWIHNSRPASSWRGSDMKEIPCEDHTCVTPVPVTVTLTVSLSSNNLLGMSERKPHTPTNAKKMINSFPGWGWKVTQSWNRWATFGKRLTGHAEPAASAVPP